MEDQGSDPDRPGEPWPRPRGQGSERARLLGAVLTESGEHGFRTLTVEAVAARAGVPAGRFAHYFDSLPQSLAAAYRERVPPLEAELLWVGAAQPTWAEGVRAVLVALVSFAVEETPTARALLTQVYVAGGEGLAAHQATLRRFSERLGRTGVAVSPRAAPPAATAPFLVGAVEQTLRWRLVEGRPALLWKSLPELMALLIGPYLGDEPARRELERPSPPPGE